MRWQQLFADLEAQFEQLERADQAVQTTDLIRAEWGQLTLLDRLVTQREQPLRWFLHCPGDALPPVLAGTLLDVGPDWLLLRTAEGAAELLLAFAVVVGVEGLGPGADPTRVPAARRIRLTVLLRALSRDRRPVTVWTAGGALTGTIERVGADHVDLAVHPLDELRRAPAVRAVRCLPLTQLWAVRAAVGSWAGP